MFKAELLKYGKKHLARKLGLFRSSCPKAFLRKGVLKICSKITGEHPCRSAISIKMQRNFIEITLRHGCSPVNSPFARTTSGGLLPIWSRLILTVLNAFPGEIIISCLHVRTDSKVSLAWIEALNKEFQTFVQNRVVEIRKKHLARKLGLFRRSCPNVFLRKDVLKICSKITGEHPCRSAISIKVQSNFFQITLWHGCKFTVNFL